MKIVFRRSPGLRSKWSRIFLLLFFTVLLLTMLWLLLDLEHRWDLLRLNRSEHRATIYGVVYDAASLQPLTGADLELDGRHTTSDTHGLYRFDAVPVQISEQGGAWYYALLSLRVTHPSYNSLTRSLPVNFGSFDAAEQVTSVTYYADTLLVASAATPPAGRLSFYDYRYRTVVTDFAGQHPNSLIDDAYHPVIAPNGRYIAYQPASVLGIWLLDMTTGGRRSLATALDPYNMSWSPDSSSLVAAGRDLAAATQGLWIARIDDNSLHKITSHPAGLQDEDPLWSPDGSRILFYRRLVSGEANRQMQSPYMLTLTTGTLQPVPAQGAWHPNGRWIAYLRPPQNEVSVVDVASGAPVESIRLPQGHDSRVILELVGWLADGRNLVFEGAALLGRAGSEDVYQHSIWIYNLDHDVLYQLLPDGRGPRWTTGH